VNFNQEKGELKINLKIFKNCNNLKNVFINKALKKSDIMMEKIVENKLQHSAQNLFREVENDMPNQIIHAIQQPINQNQ
jgi:hypothetical protein